MVGRRLSFQQVTIGVTFAFSLIVASCGTAAVKLPPPTSPQSTPFRQSVSSAPSSSLATSTTSSSQSSSQTSEKPKWLLAANVLKLLQGAAGAFNKVTSQGVIEVTPIGGTPLLGPGIVPAVKFTSAQTLVQTLQSSSLPSWAKAVVYDPEYWPLTPTSEQIDPISASEQASSAAKEAGLIYVVTPALDLSKALAPGSAVDGESLISMNLFGKLAAGADVLVIQSQSLENDPSKFYRLLSEGSSQARGVNPNVDVLGGLSTNFRGASANLSTLTTSFTSGLSFVNGYWFNVPGTSSQCPTCSSADFSLASTFFAEIAS